MSQYHVTVNLSHDASVCVSKDGEIIYFNQEEKLAHIKHFARAVSKTMDIVMSEYTDFDKIFVGIHPNYFSQEDMDYIENSFRCALSYIRRYDKNKSNIKFQITTDHHVNHAYNAYYGSNFDECAVVVVDGGGKILDNGSKEQESIYVFSGHDIKLVAESFRLRKEKKFGIANIWEDVSNFFLGDYFSAGKIMGASAYGKDDPNHPRAYIYDTDSTPIGNPEFMQAIENKEISFEDASYRLQNDSFDLICALIKDTINHTGQKNICLTGGYFQNCVNNFKLLKKFPDINFYVDPLSTDSGLSIGLNKATTAPELRQHGLKTLYLGNPANYERDLRANEKEYKVSAKQVAQLIADRNIVALYQGRGEAGHRALGNRSFLYDPRDPNGRDHVNTIKKREYYRPFAGTVMLEHAREYFDMDRLEESPFMMYAVQTLEEKRHLVPALQHNDGTSRIQTLTKEQNLYYYRVIEEFYNITNIPMVLNTSFNLAGDTIVDNMDDALRTCREGSIKYLYCPERELMIEFDV